jgi:preprotein translocase subunit SecB
MNNIISAKLNILDNLVRDLNIINKNYPNITEDDISVSLTLIDCIQTASNELKEEIIKLKSD